MKKDHYVVTKEHHVSDEWSSTWDQLSLEQMLQDIPSDALTGILAQHLRTHGPTLEAGCGMGRWVVHLNSKGSPTWGVDNSLIGLKKGLAHDPSLPFVAADVRYLPFPNGFFTNYISIGVIEHFIEGPDAVVQEASRVLKPGGIAFVSVPCQNTVRTARIKLSRLFSPKSVAQDPTGSHIEQPDHFFEYYFTPQELQSLLQKASLRVVASIPMHPVYGLAVDFPIFIARGSSLLYRTKITWIGRRIAGLLYRISPWTSAHMVMCVAVKEKSGPSQNTSGK